MEQHRARLSDKLSKQSIFEEFLTQVMSASSEFIDIRSIMSRYHTLKQLYEVRRSLYRDRDWTFPPSTCPTKTTVADMCPPVLWLAYSLDGFLKKGLQ